MPVERPAGAATEAGFALPRAEAFDKSGHDVVPGPVEGSGFVVNGRDVRPAPAAQDVASAVAAVHVRHSEAERPSARAPKEAFVRHNRPASRPVRALRASPAPLRAVALPPPIGFSRRSACCSPRRTG